jgi:guanylate kinase
VDVIGGLNLKKIFGENALAIFVEPPSLEALQFRLRHRSTETPEKIAMRIAKAQSEMAYAPKFDTIIVNDILEDALIQSELRVTAFLNKP